jgi:serine/threonine protein kinase
MPQEQALGEIERLDERCDVFSLGATLCQILTGQPPYVADNWEALFRKAARADLTDAFARLDTCGAEGELISLAKRCLAAQPEDRPRNASVLAAELTAYLESVEARLREAELERGKAEVRAREERRRRRLAVALALSVLGLVALGSSGLLWYRARQSETERIVNLAIGKAEQLRDQASKMPAPNRRQTRHRSVTRPTPQPSRGNGSCGLETRPGSRQGGPAQPRA